MQLDNSFWQFSVRVYAAPGVADECLSLQERYGIDVNVLLFCVWLAVERHVAVERADLDSVTEAVGEWHRRAVKPLRAARQEMKGLASVDAIRVQVKALELEAERIEQAKLFGLAEQRWPQILGTNVRDALDANVDRFLSTQGASGVAVPALTRAALA
jgi:uncharacterized protein (TIGR02444 family)